MTSLWPETFVENTKPSVKNILEEQGRMLSDLTQGIVYSEVRETMQHDPNVQLAYQFSLRSRFLENYKFRVMDFSHDITFYPVYFALDSIIAEEIGVSSNHVIESPDDIEHFLKLIFNSDRLKSVIGSIMRLSK